jgi:hypothetical protein
VARYNLSQSRDIDINLDAEVPTLRLDANSPKKAAHTLSRFKGLVEQPANFMVVPIKQSPFSQLKKSLS